ncbi:hypothetical protein SAMN05444008_112196 [Cnuella takakiae]|uniref:Uncharacterized protein n=1 Tax=Cnuella takakiae TaxID=1302690 RepID=A0A1M5EUE1_9BACT|nr:hypothetical protein [Cnuella takakiae]SHF82834.1 hypothetical protein SAMN05444008_112196 [Cnuella takakiae]
MAHHTPSTINAFHWHEALDRGCICMKMIDQLLLQHPVISRNEDLLKKVQQARSILSDACREIASRSMDAEGE